HVVLLSLFSSRYLTHLYLHSFPTRRSSDLITSPFTIGATSSPSLFSLSLSIVYSILYFSSSPFLSIVLIACSVAISTLSSFPLRSEEHTSELQSRFDLVCRLLLEKKNIIFL